VRSGAIKGSNNPHFLIFFSLYFYYVRANMLFLSFFFGKSTFKA